MDKKRLSNFEEPKAKKIGGFTPINSNETSNILGGTTPKTKEIPDSPIVTDKGELISPYFKENYLKNPTGTCDANSLNSQETLGDLDPGSPMNPDWKVDGAKTPEYKQYLDPNPEQASKQGYNYQTSKFEDLKSNINWLKPGDDRKSSVTSEQGDLKQYLHRKEQDLVQDSLLTSGSERGFFRGRVDAIKEFLWGLDVHGVMDEGAKTGRGSAGPQRGSKEPKDPKDGSNSGPDNSGGPFGGGFEGGSSSGGGFGSGPAGGEGTNARIIPLTLSIGASLIEQIVEVLSLIQC